MSKIAARASRDDIEVIRDPKPAPTFPMCCPVTDKLNTATAVASLYR